MRSVIYYSLHITFTYTYVQVTQVNVTYNLNR